MIRVPPVERSAGGILPQCIMYRRNQSEHFLDSGEVTVPQRELCDAALNAH